MCVAQNIATMLVDHDGKGLADHWAKTSQALLTGAILHCCYVQRLETGHAVALADVDELLSHPEMDIQAVLGSLPAGMFLPRSKLLLSLYGKATNFSGIAGACARINCLPFLDFHTNGFKMCPGRASVDTWTGKLFSWRFFTYIA